MPIKIPNDLPALSVLRQEKVPVITSKLAAKQDIRPIKIALINLMPDKITTEAQIARLLGQSPLQVELTLVIPSSHKSKNTAESHLSKFYLPFEKVKKNRYDGVIITGAPVETLAYEQVNYWDELSEIFNWSMTNATRLFCICWSAQAVLYKFFGIEKSLLPTKAFGVFRQKCVNSKDYLTRGFTDRINMPVSRHTGVPFADTVKNTKLNLLVSCPYTGPSVVVSSDRRILMAFNHIEYDSSTLGAEYHRDLEKNGSCNFPHNYFIDDDPEKGAVNSWRSGAHLLFRNWLDDVYCATPFEEEEIGKTFLSYHLT